MQAYAGYMSITGDPCGPPSSCGVSFIDHAAGFAAALGIVSSLLAAQRTGAGRDLEVSLMDTAYSMLTYLAVWNLNRGFEPVRHSGSSHQTLVPVQTFRTSNGYITIFCGKEKFWELLCTVFEEPSMATDPRFKSFGARMKNRHEVVARVQQHFLRKTTEEWLAALTGLVPCAPVRTVGQALADPDLEDRGTVVEVHHPKFGTVRQVNTPIRFPGEDRRTHTRAPSLGEHTDLVLQKYLRYDQEEVARLRQTGAI
jgi:crotonobetainyl-CoA:carnitine CoA-transferase CaiB-like acyl-CoA transferase